jgi:hypothetical protein
MKTKKRKRGRPATGKNPMIAIRWPPILLDGVDQYAIEYSLGTRGAALKHIVERLLRFDGQIRS